MNSNLKILLATSLLLGCKDPRSSTDASTDSVDQDVDVSIDEEIDFLADVDVTDDVGAELDAIDSVEASVYEYIDAQLNRTLDVSRYNPSRPGKPCGPGCRQVSFLDSNPWGEIFISDSYLTINTMTSESGGARKEIYYIDLSTLEYFLVNQTSTSEFLSPVNAYPTLSNTSIVFSIAYFSDSSIVNLVSFDIDTGIQEIIWQRTYSSTGLPSDLQRSPNRIVWWDNRSGDVADANYYQFQLGTENEELVSTGPCFICGSHGIDVDGHSIVYQSDTGGTSNLQIRHLDIESGSNSQLTSGDWDHFMPSIDGDLVVWSEARRGGNIVNYQLSDIYMYNLPSGETSTVCDNAASHVPPVSVSGRTVAWLDCRDDPVYSVEPALASIVNIYTYDVDAGTERQLTDLDLRIDSVKLHGNFAYFIMQDDTGVWSVFEHEL